MYKLPSDVYSPRCSPSGSENQNSECSSMVECLIWVQEVSGFESPHSD